MPRYRCGVWVGLKPVASVLTGIGLAAGLGGWAAEAAATKGRESGRGEVISSRPAGAPVMAIVSLSQQRITVYDADGAILQAPVSSGQTGYATPPGIFTVLEKQVEHYSNLYDDASMPFMQRLTWSGIALHAGVLPGYPASHGCIRMPHGFAERLFERTKLGMRVIVVRDDISPADFTHPALFKPLPEEVASASPSLASEPENADKALTRVADASAATDTLAIRPRLSVRAAAAAKSAAAAAAARKVEEARTAARSATVEAARASKALRRAEAVKAKAELQLRQAEQMSGKDGAVTERAQQARAAALAAFTDARAQFDQVKAEMQPKIDLATQLREQAKEAAAASVTAQEEAREAARKLSPVSVFISRATQRLYVRQAREAVFETPVSVADADRALGTYVFTAVAQRDAAADLRWSVVSMYRTPGDQPSLGGKQRRGDRHASVAPPDLAGAKLALDRIAIPKEASDRISELVAPGASLIVSDEGLSRETGKATEFIVLMSGEPQGGILIRPRRSPEVRYRYQRPSYGGTPFGWSGPAWGW